LFHQIEQLLKQVKSFAMQTCHLGDYSLIIQILKENQVFGCLRGGWSSLLLSARGAVIFKVKL
jgi:hypothetical protein